MLILLSLITVLAINFLLFLVAFKRQSDKLTDFAYSLSFISVIAATLVLTKNISPVLLLAGIMVFLWALRLGVYLVIRIRRSGKDHRFDKIRGNFFSFLKFWLGQGVVAWMLLLPILMIAEGEDEFNTLAWMGFAVWVLGLIIETISDQQKYSFKQDKNNAGKWISSGLWKYSRHPNYFGEITVWVGLYLMTFSFLDTSEKMIGLVSPLAIFITLRFISGVPPLEEYADKKWGNNKNYQEYKARTNLLIPFVQKSK